MKQDKELEQFKADLLASVKELKSGKVARSTKVDVPFVVSVRNHVGLSQSEFAQLLGVSVRTLQGWEHLIVAQNHFAKARHDCAQTPQKAHLPWCCALLYPI